MSTDEVKVEAEPAGAEPSPGAEARAEAAASADAEPRTASEVEEPANPKRPKPRRMRDMALSMAVLLVPIGLFYWGWGWVASDRQVSVVGTAENHATAASLGLAAIEPELPDGWKPISTALDVGEESVTLRTGWYSPDGDGFQVVETNGAAEDVNADLVGPGTPVEAAGIEWAAYPTGGGEAWVTELDGVIVILTADPEGVDDLPELAAGVADAA